jgi:predicted nucleic acid-binding protein
MKIPANTPVALFYDSNILLYAVSDTPEEAAKRAIARALLARSQYGLSIQVLQEFYVNVTRAKLLGREPLMTRAQGKKAVTELMRKTIANNTGSTLLSALSIHERFALSYWDAAIVAAAKSLDATTLYSEDMQHGQTIEGVTIINPFLVA